MYLGEYIESGAPVYKKLRFDVLKSGSQKMFMLPWNWLQKHSEEKVSKVKNIEVQSFSKWSFKKKRVYECTTIAIKISIFSRT